MFKDWNKIAEGCTQDPTGKNVATLACIPGLFLNIVNALILFVGLAALVIFVLGCFKLMDSSGDQKKLESARSNFNNGLLGLAIVALSFFLINIIAVFTGVECIKSFGFGCK